LHVKSVFSIFKMNIVQKYTIAKEKKESNKKLSNTQKVNTKTLK